MDRDGAAALIPPAALRGRARELRARHALALALARAEETYALAARMLEDFDVRLADVRRRLQLPSGEPSPGPIAPAAGRRTAVRETGRAWTTSFRSPRRAAPSPSAAASG